MSREDGSRRSPEDVAREHERMSREAETRAGELEGGLTRHDLGRLTRSAWEGAPRDWIDALKQPVNLMRIVAAGLGALGLLLLILGVRGDAAQAPGLAATATPAVTGSPIAQGPPVTGSVTANATFMKVSGPCNLAARFTDRFSFMASSGALTLTQLSNNHVSRGTISPDGTFTTSAEGQGYRGTVSGTTARGQHTYTAQGCNEIYDFTMTLNNALVARAPAAATVPPAATATPTPTPTATVAAGTVTRGGGPNIAQSGLGLILLIGALGLFFGGPRLAGGPLIAGQKKDEDPCAKEKARLAAAERARDAAEARRDRIEQLQQNADSTRRDADAKEKTAAELRRTASSGGMAGGPTVYTNPQQRAAIEAAEAAAAAAKAAAESAQSAYNAAGGAGERQAAGDEVYKAHREVGDATSALNACLRIQQAATPTPPPPPPSTGGGTTTGGGGVAYAPGGTGPTQTRDCVDGTVKPGSEKTSTRTFDFAEISRAQIFFDAIYPGAQYVKIDEFVEWMTFIRQGFKAGKAIKGLAGGEYVEGTLDTIDYLEIQDIPDFLTYWDKLTEAVLKGLKETSDIFIERYGKLGSYSLRYTNRTFTVTCRAWEECVGGAYVPKRQVTFENTATNFNATVGPREVHDNREIADALNRLFGQLESKNSNSSRQMAEFARTCPN